MTGQEIIDKAKTLNLPAGSYVIFGSCPLALAGIRESSDVDMLVSPTAYKILQDRGWKETVKGPNDHPLTHGDFEAHEAWNFDAYQPTLEGLLKRATVVQDVPFASLEDVRKWKQAAGRDKDFRDIELIDEYLARQ